MLVPAIVKEEDGKKGRKGSRENERSQIIEEALRSGGFPSIQPRRYLPPWVLPYFSNPCKAKFFDKLVGTAEGGVAVPPGGPVGKRRPDSTLC
ncbi:hypothetical protein KM043_004761 [Ampulex compressa]|nr:hypothetical protein KM043_004761 [Ampulex compressa]